MLSSSSNSLSLRKGGDVIVVDDTNEDNSAYIHILEFCKREETSCWIFFSLWISLLS